MFKCAILGCGGRARAHAKAYESITRGKVAAICDMAEEQLHEFGDAFDIDQRYTDIDQMLDGKVFRHKKGGVYTRLARVRARDGDMTLYASHADGSFWLRPTSMFEDGRFEPADQVRLATAELDLV